MPTTLVWDTQEAEQGQAGFQNLLVAGDRVVAWGSTRVASYQLSDGGRVWNQLLPSGADTLQDVAATGTSVVVAYNDRLRALALSNGTQQWSSPGVVTPQLVIADGWIYTSNATSFGRFALANGAAGWSKPTTYSFGRVEAVDGDTVYVWDPQFDFGPPSPSVLRALSTSDGSLRWEYDVPSRVASVAVTGGVVWLTSTDIYSQGRNGDLIALNRATGVEARRISFEDNIYGWTDVAFGAGKVVLDQGGSFGGSTPRTLRVFGLAGPVPSITTKVLPIGRVGSAYAFDLESTVGAATWTLQSGSLPGGLAVSAAGALTGTATTATSVRMTLRATAPNGRTDDRAFTLQVVPATSSGRVDVDGPRRERQPVRRRQRTARPRGHPELLVPLEDRTSRSLGDGLHAGRGRLRHPDVRGAVGRAPQGVGHHRHHRQPRAGVGGQARRRRASWGARRSPATGSSCRATTGTSTPATSRPVPRCGGPRPRRGCPSAARARWSSARPSWCATRRTVSAPTPWRAAHRCGAEPPHP